MIPWSPDWTFWAGPHLTQLHYHNAASDVPKASMRCFSWEQKRDPWQSHRVGLSHPNLCWLSLLFYWPQSEPLVYWHTCNLFAHSKGTQQIALMFFLQSYRSMSSCLNLWKCLWKTSGLSLNHFMWTSSLNKIHVSREHFVGQFTNSFLKCIKGHQN